MKLLTLIALLSVVFFCRPAMAADTGVKYLGEFCFNLRDGVTTQVLQLGALSYGAGHFSVHGSITTADGRLETPVYGVAAMDGKTIRITLSSSSDLLLAAMYTLTINADTRRGSYRALFHSLPTVPVAGPVQVGHNLTLGSATIRDCAAWEIDLGLFREMAASTTLCADIRNRLFLIDREVVLWDRAGNCPDNSFQQILFGKNPGIILCDYHDSIAGPIKICNDASKALLFNTIVENLLMSDLGLGPDHAVEQVLF